MKTLFTILLLAAFAMGTAFGQSLTYNGFATNPAGQRLANQTIALRLTVTSIAVSDPVYVETQTVTTDGTGAYTVQVGQGTAVSGTYASINWMAYNHFLRVDMDMAGGSNYQYVTNGQVLANATISVECGSSFVVNHVAGEVAPVSKSVTYGTVTNIPGEPTKCWITSNLGADHQASAVDDATEASAGWYWQFNRKKGYKNDGSTVTPAWTITSIDENSDWLTVNDPCTSELGSGWRLPTSTEWTNVQTSGNWPSWMGWTSPENSGLKLHGAGYLNTSDGSVSSRGSNGCYWSSSQGSSEGGWIVTFYSGSGSWNKALGFSVRCIND